MECTTMKLPPKTVPFSRLRYFKGQRFMSSAVKVRPDRETRHLVISNLELKYPTAVSF